MADFYLLGNATPTQMLGFVIKTKQKVIVIDGGTYEDSKQLVKFLRENCNSNVDAWFFTHPHHDHIGCFVDIRNNYPDITVGTLYYKFPDLADPAYSILARTDVEAKLWGDVDKWEKRYPTQRLLANDCIIFDDVKIRVLRVFNPAIKNNCINNSSTVYRIYGEKKSVLILGDLGIEGGKELMEECPAELLHTDYTQMAHHGQCGVSREFYEYIKPKRCIWAAPDWLWDNDQGSGFDTGIYQTVRTREWMALLGVKEHLVEKDGTQKFEI